MKVTRRIGGILESGASEKRNLVSRHDQVRPSIMRTVGLLLSMLREPPTDDEQREIALKKSRKIWDQREKHLKGRLDRDTDDLGDGAWDIAVSERARLLAQLAASQPHEH